MRFAACCARAARGHAAVPPMRLMKARRFNAVPQILELQSNSVSAETPGRKLSTGAALWEASAKMCGLARGHEERSGSGYNDVMNLAVAPRREL
jgi:hypothetical protein